MDDKSTDLERLAQFQATLLELLSQSSSPLQTLDRLRNEPTFTEFRGYLETFEPRMIEVAAELVKKWGRRSSPNDERPRKINL